ncbi:hypothetical protein ACQPZZ_13145 [Microbispora sp. CA-135349]|uniref:hypothetical protein n=1 Tax=Microbispora sp. CA-135349 TaxID=3239953 RepID=UPI003D8CC99C
MAGKRQERELDLAVGIAVGMHHNVDAAVVVVGTAPFVVGVRFDGVRGGLDGRRHVLGPNEHQQGGLGIAPYQIAEQSPDRPTGRLIFTALVRIRLISATATSSPQVLIPDLLQHRLLELLNVDPTRPRWLML